MLPNLIGCQMKQGSDFVAEENLLWNCEEFQKLICLTFDPDSFSNKMKGPVASQVDD